jgi:hypothetical protein
MIAFLKNSTDARRLQILERLLADAEARQAAEEAADAEAARADLATFDAGGIPPEIPAATSALARAQVEVEKATAKLVAARAALHPAAVHHAQATERYAAVRAALVARAYPASEVAQALEALEAALAADPGEEVHCGRINAYRNGLARVLAPVRPLLTNAATMGLPGNQRPRDLVARAIADGEAAGAKAAAEAFAAAQRVESRRWISGV